MNSVINKSFVDDLLRKIQNFTYDLAVVISNLKNIDANIGNPSMKPIIGFLQHYHHLGISHCVITAYKLFHEGEYHSISKLLNRIISQKLADDLHEVFHRNKEYQMEPGNEHLVTNSKELKILAVEILQLIHSRRADIDKILKVRSKIYAHLDKDYQSYEFNIKDLQNLQSLAVDVYKKFDGAFNSSEFLFDHNIYSIQPVINDREFHFETFKEWEKKFLT